MPDIKATTEWNNITLEEYYQKWPESKVLLAFSPSPSFSLCSCYRLNIVLCLRMCLFQSLVKNKENQNNQSSLQQSSDSDEFDSSGKYLKKLN